MNRALLALAVASFGIGTTEFVIMGLLPDVATSLRVSIPQAGLLVSGYALAVCVGAPIVAIATANWPRKATLLALMGVFIVGNLLCAVAGDYALLMGARVVTALAHGAFFGIGSVVASGLVERHQRARAIAVMFTGLTLANVLGVPLGTLLGQALGWRSTFWGVSLIGVAAEGALWVWVPKVAADRSLDLISEFRALRQPQVLLAMLMSTLSSVSLFSVFTYITPLLESRAGLSEHQVGLALLVFGVGLTVGNLIGGRLADWRLMPSVVGLFASLIVVLGAFAATSRSGLLAVATLLAWGGVAFALVAPLQMRVVEAAREARNLAATLNQGAFNFGNALGAWIGGVAIDAGYGYGALPPLGAGLALLALLVTLLAMRLESRARQPAIAAR